MRLAKGFVPTMPQPGAAEVKECTQARRLGGHDASVWIVRIGKEVQPCVMLAGRGE